MGGKKRGATTSSDEDYDATYGGHYLRHVVGSRVREGEPVTYRPRSKLLTLESAAAATTPQKSAASKEVNFEDDHDNEYDDYNDDEYDDDDNEDDGEDSGYEEDRKPAAKPTAPAYKATESSYVASVPPPTTQTQQTQQPFTLTTVGEDSALGRSAAAIFTTPGYQLKPDLAWQSAVAGDATKIKAFRQEVTQQVDIVPFAFMRPASPFIQILHSVATYAVRGGDSELHGKDFGFVGDRTNLRVPSAVLVDDGMWKWMSKQLGLDVPPNQCEALIP
jgi:hypothetical protein